MQHLTRAHWIALGLAIVAALVLFMAGAGTKIGLWDFRSGLGMLKWAAYIGVAAVVVSLLLLAVLRPKGSVLALLLASTLVGLTVVGLPWQWRRTARSVPPIHDITTDLGNPPAFEAILPLRADASNPAEYGGPEVAAQQRAGYPDIAPLFLEVSTAAAFTRSLDAARGMGWEVVIADSARGRIEAVATTRWFGFKDDVVVRIAKDGSRTRIDVRSVSRVGGSDVGTNARRIRQFVERVQGAEAGE
ncbi:MAG: DUF1499 domain-containing protein [Gemmatimonadaceae bacterium]